MSCCGCASRVLKLQSEMRSWKSKLAEEKREKKMILKWILTVFGYDVKVDIDKPTRGIRLEANENKEAASKALLKLVGIGGNEGDFGVMVMEVKLEDQEFFEPFEETHDVPEFPILEINSMPTNTQSAPIVNTGIAPIPYGHLAQPLNPVPAMSIATPMEVAAPVPISISNPGGDQEVLYLAGDFETGATLEGPNGQSYIIVRTNENEDISSTIPMQMDYSTVNDDVIADDGNFLFRGAGLGSDSPINFLSNLNQKPISISTPLLPPTVSIPLQLSFSDANPPIIVDNQIPMSLGQTASGKPQSKKKNKSLSSSASSTPSERNLGGSVTSKAGSSKKKKQTSSNSHETNLKIESVTGAGRPASKPKTSTPSFEDQTRTEGPNVGNRRNLYEQGLTLREKAEMFVLQKAKEAVEKVTTGFRCLLCEENRYTYSNFEMAVAHTKTHFESKPYKCENCDELFSVQRELLTHKKTVHPKPKGNQGISLPTSSTSKLLQSPKLKLSGTSSTTSSPNSTTFTSSPPNKTIVVQAPFDKNLIGGPISISSEVLAAIFGGSANQSVIANANSDIKPTIVIPSSTPPGELNSNFQHGINLNSIEGANVAFAQSAFPTITTSF